MITVIIRFMTELWVGSPKAHILQQIQSFPRALCNSKNYQAADIDKDKHANTPVCLLLWL